MAVKITEEMHSTFIKNGFTEEDIANTVKHYRGQGQTDDEIFNNLNNKYKSLSAKKPAQTTNNTQKKSDKVAQPQKSEQKPTEKQKPKTFQEKFAEFNKNLEMQNQKANEDVKARARENLRKRAEWEKKHPIISSIQKDYQPATVFTNFQSYRGQVPQWELEAKYGLNAPLKEKLKTDAKSLGLNLVAPVNIGVDVATGGGGKVAKAGVKELVKQGIKQGAKTGAIGGATQGVTSSLADNGISKDVLIRPIQYATGGAVGGGIVGGIANPVINKLDPVIAGINKGRNATTPKQVEKVVKAEIADIPQQNITKSEDIKNISKKDMADNKREFKQNVEDLKNPKTAKTTIRMSRKGRFWSKNIDDPYTRATQEADEEFNKILSEIKKNPEILDDQAKALELEARLEAKTNALEDEHAGEYWQKYWDAFSQAHEYNKTKTNFDSLSNRQRKVRGAIKTVEKKTNSELADSITDRTYLTRGYDVNKAQLDTMSPDEIQRLIESDDISDLSVTARAMDINRDLESGKIPLWKLNKWASDGTPIGQAMQARSLLKMDTPEGAIQVLAGTIRKATPKKVNDIIDTVPKLVEASNGGEGALNEALKRVNKRERKYLIDKIMDLKQKGELTNDNLVKVINKKYNVPEITEVDYKNIQKLTSDIENATDERQKEVAKALVRKYIGDKIPRKFMDKVNTYRYTNMLLSPKSRVKDALFTALFQGDQALDEVIANGISKAITQPLKGVKTRSGLHFNEWLEGIKKGFKEGSEDVKLGITTGRAGEGSRFDLPKAAQFRYKPLKEVEGWGKVPQAFENIMSGLEKGLAYSIRVPDRMFYEGRYASSIADQLAANNTKNVTNEMVEQAVKEARDAVYQGDTWASKASLGVRDVLNKIPLGAFKVGDWTMPFVQTVANISEEGLKNVGGVPVGAYKLLKADTPEALRDAEILLAKGIKGTVPLGVGWGVGKGYIDSNIGEKTNYNNEITGMQPQSIAIGDKSFSLANAPNLAIPISVGRALGEKGLTREGAMQALLNAGIAVSDMPAVKAVGDLTSIASTGYGQQLTPSEIVDNAVRNQGINYLTQLVPLSGFQRNIRNVVDPYGREIYTENTPEYIANRVINGIPFASNTLPIKYNAMGEPVMIDNIQNPVLRAIGQGIDLGVRNYNNNPTNNALNELSKEMEDTDVKGKTTIALKKSKRTIRINGENVKLDNEQYSQYQHEYGRINYALREQALNNPEFANLSSEEKTEYLMELRQSVEEAVKIMQFGHEPTRRLKPYTQQILDNYDKYIGE